ncbi:sugar transferase [Ulvibacterium marinum]|uniref:Sugar transferase n=1 Tax=Ulvibacterium marinum TaxID=2419782 RepID=A0A3B0BVJ0_9FLAO|nr:sugar transferase [Ulvibacterium marinum]RKN76940.1 sugar transferase [Ulvibacterium marinum]
MYKKVFKRIFDILVSLTFLVLLSPVILIITILLFFANRGKPFFLHRRPGKNEKIFTLYKFRTMKGSPKDKDGNFVPDVQRITKVGGFVRSTSLDELPQLFNVLFGDMSIVGPRPLWEHYLDLYNPFQKQRHKVKPGITGWAQINGRNSITWEEKFEFDVWYVENISFMTDMDIIFKTVKKVLMREGIASNEKDTMTMFTGTP